MLVLTYKNSVLFLLYLYLFKGGGKVGSELFVAGFFLAALLCFGLVCCHFFGSFVAVPILFRASGTDSLKDDVVDLLGPLSVLLMLSLKFLVPLGGQFNRVGVGGQGVLFCSVLIVTTGLILTGVREPRLLAESFSEGVLIGGLKIFGCRLCSTCLRAGADVGHTFTSDDRVKRVMGCTGTVGGPGGRRLTKVTGKGGMFIVSVRSARGFVVGRGIRNRRVAPFLGDLVGDASACCFGGFCRRAKRKGASSSRFLFRGSLCKLPEKTMFFARSRGAFIKLPSLLDRSKCSATIFRTGGGDF